MSPHRTITPVTLVTEADPTAETVPIERIGTLTVLSGPNLGAVYCMRGERAILGRGDDSDLVLDDDSVSRHHARLSRHGGLYTIEDLDSTNGTFVSGRRVHGPVPLAEGERLRLAGCVMCFGTQDAQAAQAARRIYEMGIRDGLTNLYNRRHLDDRMRNEVAFALRHGTPLAVIVCDIDLFKHVNDLLGHQAGDEVLRRVAAALQSTVRTEDVLARSGGEEFTVIARGIDADGARAFAERMRAMIERIEVLWQGERVPVTISLGVAHNHMVGMSSLDGDTLLAAADRALYAAKHAGRNRVEHAGSPGRYRGVEPEVVAELRRRRRRVHEQPTGPTDGDFTAIAKRRGRA